jgi:transcriptional regulator with XRE-family HTH domain
MRSQVSRNTASATKSRNLRKLLLDVLEEGSRIRLAAVGERIKQARQDAGLTQSELAEQLGLSHPQSISRYERGETEVPQRRLRRIAEVTGKPLGFFLTDDLETQEPPEDADTLALVHEVLEQLRDLRAAVARLEGQPVPAGKPRERGVSG